MSSGAPAAGCNLQSAARKHLAGEVTGLTALLRSPVPSGRLPSSFHSTESAR